ncbi:MAG: PriCT-2 domain-containing protein, partial [Bacteroidales bacterium]|nr:PriCT-2 domain-containing protein [Bacteroidales bacterium]
MKKDFNPQNWLTTSVQQTNEADSLKNVPSKSPLGDLGVILSRIEASQTDITASYSDWRDIGFALADEFGENGRNYFHRISRFYPDYSQSTCDKQFDACLKS